MKKTFSWIAAVALLAAGAVAGGYWLGKHEPAPHAAAPGAAQGASSGARKLLYYRNPMGLPDTSPVPKKDSMGMDYIPVYEGDELQNVPPGTVRIAADKVQLLGVRTEPARQRELRHTVRAVGTVQANERLISKVAPRFEGWIEKLHVNATGQTVSRGEVLMEVYSPELVAAQEEYLIALRGARELKDGSPEAQATMQRLADGVLRRLQNWQISERELATLQKSGRPQRLLAYRSPAAGVVLQKNGVQGMRFMPGDVLFEIADLSSVWLIADVAEQDLGLVRPGQQTRLQIVAFPGSEFTGKVVFVYPTLEAATRTGRVRIELPNPGMRLKPAMYGTMELATIAGNSLAVPDSAVLDSGTRQVVLVKRGEGLFEPREVKLGSRADGYVAVREGLQDGEEVVVRANFLIDAESNLKAALGGFGHAHGDANKPAAGAKAKTHRGRGKVVSLNAADGTLHIDHEPIPSLQWPAMKMEFKVKDKAAMGGLKPGQAIEFEIAEGAPGEYVVERVAPTAPAGVHGAHGG